MDPLTKIATLTEAPGLFIHQSPTALTSILKQHLPASLLIFRLLKHAEKQPNAVFLANFPETIDIKSYTKFDERFLFCTCYDLSNNSPTQQITFYSTFEEKSTVDGDITFAALYIHKLMTIVGRSIPKDYENNWGHYSKQSIIFPSIPQIYMPIFKKFEFIDWKSYDYGACYRFILWFEPEYQLKNLGYTMDHNGAPKLPHGYTWGYVTDPDIVDSFAKYPRSRYLLNACENAAIFFGSEMVAWIYESPDGSSISLFIKPEHRLSGFGMLLTYEIMRRGCIRYGGEVRKNGIYWHWEIMKGNKGSERIMERLGCTNYCQSFEFGVDVADLEAFASNGDSNSGRKLKAKL